MTTPKLQMPELVVGQAGKELTHNQALAVLDQLAQAVVVDKDLAAPPVSPANGVMYIVAAGATGAWSGQSGKLAYWLTTVAAWTFITPVDGWSVWVADEAKRYERVGGAWAISSAGANSAALDGLTGAANKLPYFTGVGALALADYTAAARAFDAAVDAAGQRTALGLGTAAVANVTTSTTDITPGRVLKVGDAGVLGIGVPITNMDLVPSVGYSFFGELASGQGAGANYPFGSDQNWHSLNIAGANTNRGAQLAFGSTTYRVSVRWRSAGATSPWAELWSSVGANAITVDTGSFGYGVGSGGTITQATSKATAVTLNKPSGRITTAADSLAAGASVLFVVSNSKVANTDVVLITVSGANTYRVECAYVSAGVFGVRITNVYSGALAEAIQLNFAVLKGAAA